MAKKTATVTQKINYPTEPSIKFVKKANLWCKTYFEGTTQKQEWSEVRPSEEAHS